MEIDENVLSLMLTSASDSGLRDLLVAMSFLDDSIFSAGVLQSLYALAALHLYGHKRAQRFKAKAVQALDMAAKATLSMVEKLQRIAARLLLSLYEVQIYGRENF